MCDKRNKIQGFGNDFAVKSS